jgi:formylglycine-generating enzyme required for sulfatase activity
MLLGGAALVATLAGAAQIMRGPHPFGPRLFAPVAAEMINAAPVTLEDGRILKVQTREVTVAEWQACHDAGACELDFSRMIRDVDHPATGLSYPDAMQYLAWTNDQSASTWRLPTAAEWRELALEVMPEQPPAIFTDPSMTWASSYLTEAAQTGRALRPSGSFSTTSGGIQDLDGNVWEWTQDCYTGTQNPSEVIPNDRCPAFIMGGEHEAVMSYLVRDPARGGCAVGAPPPHLGMRLVSEISG